MDCNLRINRWCLIIMMQILAIIGGDSFVLLVGIHELFVNFFYFYFCNQLVLQVWLLALVILPARSHIIMRFGLVVYLTLISVWVLPKDVWMVSDCYSLT